MVKFNYSGIGNVKGGEKVVVVQFEFDDRALGW